VFLLVPAHPDSPDKGALKQLCVSEKASAIVRYCNSASEVTTLWRHTNTFIIIVVVVHKTCLQCFDAVGWVAGRASGL